MEYVIFNEYGSFSIEGMMKKYAPPEKNTEAYIRMIVNATGRIRDTILNILNSSERTKLLETVMLKEIQQRGRIMTTDIWPE